MRDDLTYRQQRNINLISEALLTGRTELAEQALNEQFPGMGGRSGPKLTMDTTIGQAEIKVGKSGRRGKKNVLKDIKNLFNTIAAIPGDVVDVIDDNITAELLRALNIKTREGTGGGLVTPSEADILAAILIAAGLIPGPPSIPNLDPTDDDDGGQNPV